MNILVYGYGNPGRQDDALGVRLAENIEQWVLDEHIQHVEVDYNYQLNIEDSDPVLKADIVIFADASIEEMDDFLFTKVNANDSTIEFTMQLYPLLLCWISAGSYMGNVLKPILYILKDTNGNLRKGFPMKHYLTLQKQHHF